MRYWLFILICTGVALLAAPETTVPVNPEVADALRQAIGLERSGNIKESERILLKTAALCGKSEQDQLELALVLNNLAVLYMDSGRFDDGERHLKRSIRILQGLPTTPHVQHMLAKTRLHLAGLYLDAGRGKDALKLNVPSIIEELRNPDDKIRAKSTLAALATYKNDFKTAEQIYEDVLLFWKEPSRAADSQAEIATALNNLGAIALWQGRTEVARQHLEESLVVWRNVEGPASPNLIKAMANIGSTYLQAKQYEEAVTWLSRSSAAGKRTFGETHPYTVSMQFAYADALKKAGRKFEAKEMEKAAVASRSVMRNPSVAGYTVDYRDLMSLSGKGR